MLKFSVGPIRANPGPIFPTVTSAVERDVSISNPPVATISVGFVIIGWYRYGR